MSTSMRTQIAKQIGAVAVVLSAVILAVASTPGSAAASESSECDAFESTPASQAVARTSDVGLPGGQPLGSKADNRSKSDSALLMLAELTSLLDQSSRSAPAIVDGRLKSSCEIVFLLDGVPAETGATGITELRMTQSSRWLVQALDGNRGHRMMAVLEDATAPTAHTVGLELAPGVLLKNKQSGGAAFVNEKDHVIGSVLSPWAFDANGNELPVTQTITDTSIVIVVDTTTVTAWPVIVDPTYHNLNCTPSMVTTAGTASQYLNGSTCPVYEDIIARGYYPQWIHHFERWRVGKPDGGCGEPIPIPD